jgi:hypothetical protein
MSDKKPGAIRKTAGYIMSPRMFMSAEDVQKYGGFSLRYHRELLGEIKRSFKALKESKQNVKSLTLKSVEERLMLFYDTLYENAISEEELSQIHKMHGKRAKLLFGVSLVVILISFCLFFIPNITIIPNILISVATLIVAASVLIKAFSFNYYAWLIEQRLLPEAFGFKLYMKKAFKRWPKTSLSQNMQSEIKNQYQKRDEELKGFLERNPDKTLDDIGLGHLKERLSE